jgi:holo-[acyl-carrier protein] synthase
MEYCMSKADPSIHFAGTFAAKEAATKAASALTSRRIPIAYFEVIRRKNGAPRVRYTGRNSDVKKIEIRVSVSHTTQDAVAVAIAVTPGLAIRNA